MEVVAATIEWGVASAPSRGESRCGDVHVVKPFHAGVLVAALDGLGHGAEAAQAADLARTILEGQAAQPLPALFRQCHDALRGTRGVVMSLGSLDLRRGLLTWLGVGNVQGVLLRRGPTVDPVEESLLLRAGVVGAELPNLQTAVLPVSDGDTLVFVTDGIARGFSHGLARSLAPRKAAEAILSGHSKANDDALALVARYVGNHE